MPHNRDLQKKLHETRTRITRLEMEIEDLLDERARYQAKINQINARILELKKQIVTLEKTK
jgi:peptidoglycan hydrolase CwlO-like protein